MICEVSPMTQDKRILRTKKSLKSALIKILSQKPFEKITVKEICKNAKTTRMTFYTHYNDKYDLLDDISKDIIKKAQDEYHKLQNENNQNKNSIISYCNFLDSILNTCYNNLEFFSQISSYKNPYLNLSFSKSLNKYLEIHAKKRSDTLKPKYSFKKISGFLCSGLLEFINQSNIEKSPPEKVKSDVKNILRGILDNEILTKNTIK